MNLTNRSSKKSQTLIVSPFKKNNEGFESRYFPHSEKKIENPQSHHTISEVEPLDKFKMDISSLAPVSYQCPNQQLLNRNYVVVQEKIIYGESMTPEKLEEFRNQRRRGPEVVTWGHKDERPVNSNVSIPLDDVQLEKLEEQNGFWCCAPSISIRKNYSGNYR